MTPSEMDRIAELCVRHHLGQYRGRVARRLDELLAAPLDQLEATTAALLKACDYLNVTGQQLEAVLELADRPTNRRAGDPRPRPSERSRP